MNKKRFLSLIMTVIMSFTALSGCNKNDTTKKENNNSSAKVIESAVIPITKDENTITPFTYVTGTPGMDVQRLIFDSLFTEDKDNKILPWLAKEAKHNSDYTEYTVELNKDIKWHDDKDFSAEDVKFTFEYVLTQKVGRWKTIASKVQSMEIKNNSIIFKLKNPEPNFVEESLVDIPIVPKHIYEGKDGKQIKETIGTGLYKLKEYVPEQKYVLEANDKFFKGKAKIKTINMPIMKDSNAIYQGLQTGEYLTFTGTITPELIKTFSEKKDLKVLTGPGFSATMVYMNNQRPHFDNPEFRKAISLSIDNKEIVNRVFLDKADVGTAGFYSINSPFAKKGLDYKYDVKEAEKILDSLGYDKKNESGIRLTKEGKELSFEILSSNNAMRQSAATIISEQLKKVGIKLNVKVLEADTLDSLVWPDFDITKERKYDMTVFGWSAPMQTKQNTLIQHGSSDTKKGILNLAGYKNAEFDSTVEEFAKSNDKEKRKELVNKMQDIFAKTYPFHVYAYQNVIAVYNSSQYDEFVLKNGVGIINVFSFLNQK